MTLDAAHFETPVRITGFDGLTQPDLERLSAHGVDEGALIIKILRTPLRDPIECQVGPQLLTLDAWLLPRIKVAPQP